MTITAASVPWRSARPELCILVSWQPFSWGCLITSLAVSPTPQIHPLDPPSSLASSPVVPLETSSHYPERWLGAYKTPSSASQSPARLGRTGPVCGSLGRLWKGDNTCQMTPPTPAHWELLITELLELWTRRLWWCSREGALSLHHMLGHLQDMKKSWVPSPAPDILTWSAGADPWD